MLHYVCHRRAPRAASSFLHDVPHTRAPKATLLFRSQSGVQYSIPPLMLHVDVDAINSKGTSKVAASILRP